MLLSLRLSTIIDGKIVGMVASSHKQLWKIMPDDPLSLESLHGFSWLRHLRAQGGEAARLTEKESAASDSVLRPL